VRAAAAAAFALAVLALLGCDDSTSSAGLACSAPPGDQRAGEALVHVPPASTARGDRFPVLIITHPAGSEGPSFGRGLDVSRRADKEGVLVLYPTSRRQGFWQLNHRAGDTDVDGVKDLLDDASARFCADLRRVAVAGVSNGGGFATRLACELPDRIRAAVSIAGSYRALDPCAPNQPVSFLEIHGTGDTVVPYKRGVLRFVEGFARHAGCDAAAQRTTPRRGVTRLRWRGCDGGAAVEHLRLAATGHGWPGLRVNSAHPPRDPTGVRATDEIYRFMRQTGVVPER
jgi:polyhydroxybutyrate depolymerase